jgi:hypothetical protein
MLAEVCYCGCGSHYLTDLNLEFRAARCVLLGVNECPPCLSSLPQKALSVRVSPSRAAPSLCLQVLFFSKVSWHAHSRRLSQQRDRLALRSVLPSRGAVSSQSPASSSPRSLTPTAFAVVTSSVAPISSMPAAPSAGTAMVLAASAAPPCSYVPLGSSLGVHTLGFESSRRVRSPPRLSSPYAQDPLSAACRVWAQAQCPMVLPRARARICRHSSWRRVAPSSVLARISSRR